MALQHWTWEKDDSGIVTLAIAVDGKSVNVLTKAVFAEMETLLTMIEAVSYTHLTLPTMLWV